MCPICRQAIDFDELAPGTVRNSNDPSQDSKALKDIDLEKTIDVSEVKHAASD